MRFTLTTTDTLADELIASIFSNPGFEGAAYLLCGTSVTANETRLLARTVVPVAAEDYLVREPYRMSIASDSYVPLTKRARDQAEAIVFVHSHPEAYPDFSPQDDIEEPKLHSFFASRSPGLPHGSLVFNTTSTCRGRIWSGGNWQPVERVRILGRRFRFIDNHQCDELLPDFFDRQVRAFGPDIQRLLRRLHAGVVGAGGTGSPVIEQLTRLGIGKLSVFDGQAFDATNVTRVFGSTLADHGRPKTEIQERHVKAIGLDTDIKVYPRHITDEATAKVLRDCDVIFGCTDKHAPRGLLVQLALRYLIPVFDMGVRIASDDGVIRGIWGRVTTLLPGESCLFCRGHIDAATIRAEGLPADQRDQELAEGYIPELDTTEPAVVMFTSSVASQAITEFLHRLTGFMGTERQSSEVIMRFHETRSATNREPAKPDCVCQVREHWGRGDTMNFLGRTW